jgi:predicted nucleic acid-binding protein
VILADTSVWIEHLRSGHRPLGALLDTGGVLAHPWVIGELALGNLRDRDNVLRLLGRLPQAVVATDEEVLRVIDDETLHGAGIGYVDAQLLASSRLTPDARLWTNDQRLSRVAARLGVASWRSGR